MPVDENTVLVDLDNLVKSVPQNALRTTVDELGKAFDNAGPSLQHLIDRGNEVIKAFQGNLAQTISLIEDAKTVLGTQIDVSGAFQSFASNIAAVSDTLRSSDPDIRRLLSNGVLSATELNALIKDNQSDLGSLIANVVTLGQIQLARLPGLDELLTLYPRVLSTGERVVQDPAKGARFGLDLDQFPVCTKGYAPTSTQHVPDGSAAQQNRPFPLNYSCTEPLSSGTDVRGSRNAPRPAGDTTDPALGGYAYGQASYLGSANGKVVDGAAFDPEQRPGLRAERPAVPDGRERRAGRGTRRQFVEIPPPSTPDVMRTAMTADPQQTTAPRRSGLAKLRGTPVLDPPELDELTEAPPAEASVFAPEPVLVPPASTVDLVKRPPAGAPKGPRGTRRMRRAVVALAVVAALLLTGVLLLGDRLSGGSKAAGGAAAATGSATDSADRLAALRAAHDFTVSFFTYDYRDVAAYFKRIEAASTGTFRTDFVSKEKTLKTVLANLKTVATGQVPDGGAGIFALADGKAVAFVAANMNASNAVTKNGQQRYRVKLSLQKVKDAWLVTDFQEVL